MIRKICPWCHHQADYPPYQAHPCPKCIGAPVRMLTREELTHSVSLLQSAAATEQGAVKLANRRRALEVMENGHA